MRRRLVFTLTPIIIAMGMATQIHAETSAEDAYDYRIAIMTTLRGHLVASSMIVRGLVEDDGHLAVRCQMGGYW